MYILNNKGQELYFDLLNFNSDLPIVLFLNGLSQTTESWSLIVNRFINHYRIVLLDFVFQGKSSHDGEWKNFDEHAEDVYLIVEHLKIDKFNLVGISYGSLVGQNFAVNYPHKLNTITLLSTFANKSQYYNVIENSWEKALDKGGAELLFDVMLPFVLSDNYFNNPLIPIEVITSAKKNLNQTISLSKLMKATINRDDYRKELNKIKIPTLILHGEKDLLFPVSFGLEVSNNIPNSVFIVIQNVGHTLNLEGIDEVYFNIKKFIDYHENSINNR